MPSRDPISVPVCATIWVVEARGSPWFCQRDPRGGRYRPIMRNVSCANCISIQVERAGGGRFWSQLNNPPPPKKNPAIPDYASRVSYYKGIHDLGAEWAYPRPTTPLTPELIGSKSLTFKLHPNGWRSTKNVVKTFSGS